MRKLTIYFFVLLFSLVLVPLGEAGKRDPAGTANARCEPINGLVILTQFPDIMPSVPGRYAHKRFFEELNAYVQEMSYGRYCVTGDVTQRWYQLPRPVADYKISPRNLEVDKSRLRRLIGDALGAVDRDVDFSQYDFVALFLGAKASEYGMIGLCGYPGMLGWQAEGALRTPSGQQVRNGIAIFSYQAHLGTLFHDVAHVIGGVEGGKRRVPCLYDHDLQAKPSAPTPQALRQVFLDATINMGLWDPMSSHYNDWKLPPPGISSWTKLRLGWLAPSKVRVVRRGETAEVVLDPLEKGAAAVLAIRIPLTADTYYLVENRQAMGFDRYIPGSGVLILHADDRIAECRHGKAPVRLVNANPTVPHLKGAAFDLGKNERFVDEQNGVEIRLLGKEGDGYRVRVKSAGR